MVKHRELKLGRAQISKRRKPADVRNVGNLDLPGTQRDLNSAKGVSNA